MSGTGASPTRWRALFAAVLRESRAARGRLVFFTLCLAIGVAAVVGVSALIESIDAGLRGESRSLLAADLVVSARRPLPPELDAALAELPHERARVVELAAMAQVPGGDSRLVELKAVDAGYPFYGELRLDPPTLTAADLGPDGVFVGPELRAALDLALGDELSIGGEAFQVAAFVVDEPDRLDFAMTLGARVFLGPEGLERTGLESAQSRVKYKALLRLGADAPPLAAVERDLRSAFEAMPYVRVRAHTNAQPNVRRSLGNVEEFLGLVALLSLLLGGIGVSQIVRAWLAGRVQSVAVMRCLGFRAREVAVLYLGHVTMLALAGCVIGGALGACLPWLASRAAPELFQAGAQHLWQPMALLRGVSLGVLVALLFSLLPLTAVWRVPPASVLRAQAAPLAAPRALRWGAAALMFGGVLLSARLQGGTWLAAASFAAGLGVLAGLLWAGARVAMAIAARLPRGRLGPYLEHGLASMARPGAGTAGAVVALGIGVMVVLSMLLIEGRLDTALREALPEEAPSVFMVDVQPDQWEGVRAAMSAEGATHIDSVPVVMARLRALDGRGVNELAEERRGERRAAWMLTREQRLTWLTELPEDNELTAGALWSDPAVAEVSIEQDFAEDLGVGLGSVLSFDVQGLPLELHVTSLRSVDWQSFGINFFFVVEPGVLEEAPHFRIAAARLEPVEAEYALQNALAASFPNVTLLRVRPILEKVAGVLSRVALGVRGLGSFTILTGLVILAGAVATGALRRAREAALLKALGVTRGGVARLFAVEYALSGLIAGTLGALGALALSWAFLEHVAELDAQLPFVAVPITALTAAVLATLSGLAASLRALRARPLETLRG